jgi:Tfp pilus assembly protein PilO
MAEIEQTPVATEVVIVEPPPATQPPDRPRKVSGGMWGPLEIAAVTAGALVLLAVIAVYMFFVVPSNRELAHNKVEAERLDAELASAKSKYGEITSTKDQVNKLVESVDDFETRFLPVSSNGQPALYQRLNGLIAAYGLVNTSGPDYAPLETIDQNNGQQQTDEERGRSRFKSLYPGVYVSTTLEGSYQNLRRFIREIETGREFIVISSIELAPSDTDGAPKDQKNPAQAPVPVNPAGAFPPGSRPLMPPVSSVNQPSTAKKPTGKTRGEVVSLHLEMAAYFRRPNFVPMASEQ